MITNWKIGDLVYIPKIPLAFYSRIGDSDFWKLGIIIQMKADIVTYYCGSLLGEIHVAQLRKPA